MRSAEPTQRPFNLAKAAAMARPIPDAPAVASDDTPWYSRWMPQGSSVFEPWSRPAAPATAGGAMAVSGDELDEIDRAVQLTVAELDEMSWRSFGGPDPQSEDAGRAPRSPANLSDLGAGEPVAREMRTPFDKRRK
jgi:hypothetical protein